MEFVNIYIFLVFEIPTSNAEKREKKSFLWRKSILQMYCEWNARRYLMGKCVYTCTRKNVAYIFIIYKYVSVFFLVLSFALSLLVFAERKHNFRLIESKWFFFIQLVRRFFFSYLTFALNCGTSVRSPHRLIWWRLAIAILFYW